MNGASGSKQALKIGKSTLDLKTFMLLSTFWRSTQEQYKSANMLIHFHYNSHKTYLDRLNQRTMMQRLNINWLPTLSTIAKKKTHKFNTYRFSFDNPSGKKWHHIKVLLILFRSFKVSPNFMWMFSQRKG